MKTLYLSWLTDGDASMNKTVEISEAEFKKLGRRKGFPREIDLDGNEDGIFSKPHPLDRPALYGEGVDDNDNLVDDGSKANCTMVIY